MVCPASEGLRHRRSLSDEAPPLPLPEYSSPLALQMHAPTDHQIRR